MPAIAPQNVTEQPLLPHMEVMNPATGDVWLSQAPITYDAFKALRVLPPLVKSGCTSASFTAAHFRRSPGAAADGPLETCTVDGRVFARVARAMAFAGKTPLQVKVDKHHVMTFGAGREAVIARLPAGECYVQQTESVPGKTFTAPAEWQLHRVTLAADWTVYVPPPVSVWFFASLASFQGPIPVDALPPDLREKLT